jgi:hypothetical protein
LDDNYLDAIALPSTLLRTGEVKKLLANGPETLREVYPERLRRAQGDMREGVSAEISL